MVVYDTVCSTDDKASVSGLGRNEDATPRDFTTFRFIPDIRCQIDSESRLVVDVDSKRSVGESPGWNREVKAEVEVETEATDGGDAVSGGCER